MKSTKENDIIYVEDVTRDNESVAINVSTISGLDITDALKNDDLFEVSVLDTYLDNRWSSKAVSWGTIFSKLQSIGLSYWGEQYKDCRFATLTSYLPTQTKDTSTLYQYLGPTGLYDSAFVENNDAPFVWGDVWTLAYGMKALNENVDELEDKINGIESERIVFSSASSWITDFRTWQTGSYDTTIPVNDASGNRSLAKMYSQDSTGIHTGFLIAMIDRKKISSVYECGKTGILSLYGWLDTTAVQDRSFLPDAWCALEGYINGEWEILKLVNVLPNKQLCYVSFSVPVMEGLSIRIRTGFVPGNASGRYSKENVEDSLSNHVPNAFVGGIYYNVSSETAATPKSAPKQKNITIKQVIQNVTNPPVDITHLATKDEVKKALPTNYYGREQVYTRDQVEEILKHFVSEDAVVSEVADSKMDDKPVNRIAVLNALKKGEVPVGSIIQRIKYKGDRKELVVLQGSEEWALCNGVTLSTKDYPDLAAALGVSGEEFQLPEDSDADIFSHYIKIRSSYSDCKNGWSRGLLKAQGNEVEPKISSWRKSAKIVGVLDAGNGKYNSTI